jgi:hypothetical protein
MTSAWAHSAADRGTRAGVAAEIRAWMRAAADSPIYSRLANAVAEDPVLLDLVARIDNVPPMNLLFGAVQLLRGGPLPDLPYDAFREYALAHEERIVEIGRTRRTQTNEARRAAVILPFVASAARELGGKVHVVEIGAAAGLVTCLDRYAYDYGQGVIGDSTLTLTCENRGGFAVPDAVPGFASRTGLDLAPVDVDDPDAVAWLEALVWPEHAERLERLRAAIAIRRETPLTMIAGDALTELSAVVSALPPGPVLIQHTVALYQMDAAWHRDLDDVVLDIARNRDIARVSFEPSAESLYPLIRTALATTDAPAVGVGHHHGAWVDRVG